ncbi:hypothetical protein [Calidifontibacillus erzurumensis]|uniref:Uncharacterized protein n=1 Tax=Calidifontibacillus erzurumensis TaxID=2741433 RepID=A0A8J8GH56_9BACI|nr:hypothetical protein [Calidifontibacillus erzurumensis]NSL51718.1 hypothetical protein [Calidifontibacillus erzurumensis]
MKIHVKRDNLKGYQKAYIELADIEEWATIRMALRHYKEWMEEHNWHKDDNEGIRDMYEKTKIALEELDPINEVAWNGGCLK